MKEGKCPDCGAAIQVSNDVVIGEITSCPDCGLELEIKKLDGNHLDLQELLIEGEDWGE